MSELKVNKISPRSGTAVTLGDSGDTFTIPSGATLAIQGTVSGFTSAGIDDNATSVAITISSAEDVTFTEDILLGDSKKAIFGAGSDLEIFHNGSNSYISDNGTGDLYIRGSSQIRLTNTGASENYAVFNDNGAVSLYHDNSKKFDTTATGIDVTGAITATGNLTSLGIDDNATSTAITIDVSERVLVSSYGSYNFIGCNTVDASDNERLFIGAGSTASAGRGGLIALYGNEYATSPGAVQIQTGTAGGDFLVSTNGNEAMRITSAGNVGIGTSAPTAKLQVEGTLSVRTSSTQSFNDSSNANNLTMTDSKAHFNVDGIDKDFQISSDTVTNALFVQGSDGKVGIGTSSPDSPLDILTSGNSGLEVNAGTSSAHRIYLGNTGGTSVVGTLSNHNFAVITNGSERMRIDSSGKVGIGTSSPSHKLSVSGQVGMTGLESTYTQKSFIKSSNSNNYTLEVHNTAATPGAQYIMDVSFTGANPPDNSAAKFFEMRSGGARVNINSDGDIYNHDGTYGTISDERIKQNIVDASSQWDDIKNIRVRRYKKKQDVAQYGIENAQIEIGVISQELETVSPGLIKEDKPDSSHVNLHEDFIGDNPQNVKYVKYSILYMKAIKALQEAMERIETLEAKVTTLENN